MADKIYKLIFEKDDGTTNEVQFTAPQGEKGNDGTSVTVSSVSESAADGGSNVVTFSDGKTLTVKNGSKGKDGTNGTNGKDGKDGIDGNDGESAYEYAQDGGYTGTEAEFAEDINPDNIKAEIKSYVDDAILGGVW